MLIQVLRTQGSVPREAGTRMLVSAEAVTGTIGGGHLELQAIRQARAMLATGAAEPHDLHYALGPSLGQCCGGALTLRTQVLDAATPADWPATQPLFHLQIGRAHV